MTRGKKLSAACRSCHPVLSFNHKTGMTSQGNVNPKWWSHLKTLFPPKQVLRLKALCIPNSSILQPPFLNNPSSFVGLFGVRLEYPVSELLIKAASEFKERCPHPPPRLHPFRLQCPFDIPQRWTRTTLVMLLIHCTPASKVSPHIPPPLPSLRALPPPLVDRC